jgi:uncharacterized protein YycO
MFRKLLILPLILFSLAALFYCISPAAKSSFEKIKTSSTIELKTGDIIFQSGSDIHQQAIKEATKSKFSHCGIIFIENGKQLVYEAVQPVTVTPLKQWIKRGDGFRYTVCRLKQADSILTDASITKMQLYIKKQIGKDYDFKFMWDDSEIYCSELVWKAYTESTGIKLCAPKRMKEYDLSSKVVKQSMEIRYGKSFPLEELMVAPEDIYKSDLVYTVLEK